MADVDPVVLAVRQSKCFYRSWVPLLIRTARFLDAFPRVLVAKAGPIAILFLMLVTGPAYTGYESAVVGMNAGSRSEPFGGCYG
jgi:hypothetical protein